MSDRPVGGAFHALCAAWLMIVCAIIYSNTLDAPFTFDDFSNIKDYEPIRVTQLGIRSLLDAGFDDRSMEPRPVAYISFALNYYFGEYEVRGYHVANIFIHWLSGILVYWLASDLFRRQRALQGGPLASGHRLSDFLPALFAAGIFVAHPIQTQSVTYIVQRMTSMATMFYLLALVLYLCGRDRTGPKRLSLWVGSAACWCLALGSKQIAITLPMLIFLYEWYFLQNLRFDWLKRQLPLLAAVVISMAFFAGLFLAMANTDGYRNDDHSTLERLLSQSRVLMRYLSLLALPLPSRLNLSHEVPLSHSLLDPISTLFSMLALLALFLASIRTARSNRTLSFCILWFFINLALESTFVPIELMYEHRLYLPMLAFSILVADIFRRASGRREIWVVAVSAGLIIALGFGTYERNKTWRDRITLWSDVIAKSPEDTRAYSNLGKAYGDIGELDTAIAHLNRSIELNETYYPARVNLAGIAIEQGDRGKAIDHLLSALAVDPDPYFAEAHLLVSNLLSMEGRWAEAREHAKEALRLIPNDPTLLITFARVLMRDPDRNAGDLERAIRMAERANTITRHSMLQMLNMLALLYAADERFSDAAGVVSTMLEIELAAGGARVDRLRARMKAYRRSSRLGADREPKTDPQPSS